MKLQNLLKNITNNLDKQNQSVLDITISGLALNSNQIQKHWAFVAIQGSKIHGEEFAKDAVKKGAVVILSDKDINNTAIKKSNIPVIVIENLIDKLDVLAGVFYPKAKQQKIIAITGTNGKTSITSFLAQTFDGLGVINQTIGTLNNNLTTPDIFSLYQKLNDFNGEWSILEVSSHALTQGRTKGLEFEVVVWSNLSQDHLDYHQTMEEYGKAKLLITKQSEFGIFNQDDKFYPNFAQRLTHSSFGLGDIITTTKEFGFLCNIDNIIFELNLLGEFNIYNMLATYKTLLHLGFDKIEVLKNIAKLTNPEGRMDKIQDKNIWIDFAHTPDGLKNALSTLKQHYPQNKISVVFGCGGNRDKDKRAKMAKIAGELADRIILTNDNPRDEKPEDIIVDIKMGTQKSMQVILDRGLAIEAAISDMEDEDGLVEECVLIAGKGHEKYQVIKGKKIEFNDKDFVNYLLS